MNYAGSYYTGAIKNLTSIIEANTNEERRPNRTVCYSLPSEVIDGIKYIAYFDRRKLNAVVTEAFAQYIERWNNAEHKIEKPKKA